jgi:hypothetical protein
VRGAWEIIANETEEELIRGVLDEWERIACQRCERSMGNYSK